MTSGDSSFTELRKALKKNKNPAPAPYNPSNCWNTNPATWRPVAKPTAEFYATNAHAPAMTGNTATAATAEGKELEARQKHTETPRASDIIQFDANGLTWKILATGPFREKGAPATDLKKTSKPVPNGVYLIDVNGLWTLMANPAELKQVLQSYKTMNGAPSGDAKFQQTPTQAHAPAATGSAHQYKSGPVSAPTGQYAGSATGWRAVASTGAHAAASTGAHAAASTGAHAPASTGAHAAANTGGYRQGASKAAANTGGAAHSATTGCCRCPNGGRCDQNGQCVDCGEDCYEQPEVRNKWYQQY